MKRDKTITWQHRDPRTLHLHGMEVAIISGTRGI